MTSKLCKYRCGTLLEGFDEEARKFLEAGTGGLHTKERCQEAKAKLAQKDDHGNEDMFAQAERDGYDRPKFIQELEQSRKKEYVDHTAKLGSKKFDPMSTLSHDREDKDDHGNENFWDTAKGKEIMQANKTSEEKYIDHTLKPRLKIKTFVDPTPEGLDLQVNNFGDTHKITAGQYRIGGSQYSTQVWYEEVK
jgi:hypothetical protein